MRQAMPLQELIDRVRGEAARELAPETPSIAIQSPTPMARPVVETKTAAPQTTSPLPANLTSPPTLDGWEAAGVPWDEALLAAPDPEWVNLAYHILLGRPADATGETYYRTEHARFGSRYKAILQMRSSPEAASIGRPVAGLWLVRLLLLFGKIGARLRLGRAAYLPIRLLERHVQKRYRAMTWMRAAEFSHQGRLHEMTLILERYGTALRSHDSRLDAYVQILQSHTRDITQLAQVAAQNEQVARQITEWQQSVNDQAAFGDRRITDLASDLNRLKRRYRDMIETPGPTG